MAKFREYQIVRHTPTHKVGVVVACKKNLVKVKFSGDDTRCCLVKGRELKPSLYNIEYNMLPKDETMAKKLHRKLQVEGSSISHATDQAEKLLISDGLPFKSFEIVKVELVD